MATETYKGFQISWDEPPVSQAMWPMSISTGDAELQEILEAYLLQNGPVAVPVGPLDRAKQAARDYIDTMLISALG